MGHEGVPDQPSRTMSPWEAGTQVTSALGKREKSSMGGADDPHVCCGAQGSTMPVTGIFINIHCDFNYFIFTFIFRVKYKL